MARPERPPAFRVAESFRAHRTVGPRSREPTDDPATTRPVRPQGAVTGEGEVPRDPNAQPTIPAGRAVRRRHDGRAVDVHAPDAPHTDPHTAGNGQVALRALHH